MDYDISDEDLTLSLKGTDYEGRPAPPPFSQPPSAGFPVVQLQHGGQTVEYLLGDVCGGGYHPFPAQAAGTDEPFRLLAVAYFAAAGATAIAAALAKVTWTSVSFLEFDAWWRGYESDISYLFKMAFLRLNVRPYVPIANVAFSTWCRALRTVEQGDYMDAMNEFGKNKGIIAYKEEKSEDAPWLTCSLTASALVEGQKSDQSRNWDHRACTDKVNGPVAAWVNTKVCMRVQMIGIKYADELAAADLHTRTANSVSLTAREDVLLEGLIEAEEAAEDEDA
jgi:hypothetical protein